MQLNLFLLCLLISLAYSDTETETTQQKPNYGGLIVPHVRNNTHLNDTSTKICGGTTRGSVHYMTSQDMNSEFKWYIQSATPDSSCLFRISDQVDQNNETGYVNLIPLGRTDVGADGFFPCGEKSGIDSAYFDIPDAIDCDACILEWIWKGPDFLVRHCADISVIGGQEDNKCYGLCQNGGICRKGVCVCPEGYSGENCQIAGGAIGRVAKKVLATVFFVLLLILLLILLIMLLYCCAKRKIESGEKKQVYHTNRKYMEFDVEMPNQPSGVDRPAERIRAESQNEY